MSGMSDLLAGMRKVEIDQIEQSLDAIWREMNANTLTSGGVAVSRNSVMTLVIFTRDEAEAARALETVERPGSGRLSSIGPAGVAMRTSEPDMPWRVTFSADTCGRGRSRPQLGQR